MRNFNIVFLLLKKFSIWVLIYSLLFATFISCGYCLDRWSYKPTVEQQKAWQNERKLCDSSLAFLSQENVFNFEKQRLTLEFQCLRPGVDTAACEDKIENIPFARAIRIAYRRVEIYCSQED